MTQSYDTSTYEDENANLPDGVYKVYITSEEWLDIDNTPLKLEFEVIEGEQKGRKHSELYFINHPKEDASRISRGRLKRLATNSGGDANDSNPFKGRTCIITIKNKGEYANIVNVKPDGDQL